jgi:hypothetical protein
VRALIAARHLMSATHLRKHSHVDVLNVRPRDTYGDDVLRLARGSAGMATDTAGVVNDLRPLDAVLSSWFWLRHVFGFLCGEIYHGNLQIMWQLLVARASRP